MKNTIAAITYAILVSQETVRIYLTLSALNYFPVKVAEIQNTYIMAPVKEKILTVLGRDFGEDAGRKDIGVRAIYGMKSAGSAFWNYLAVCMHHFKFLSYPAELDILMKPMVRLRMGSNITPMY